MTNVQADALPELVVPVAVQAVTIAEMADVGVVVPAAAKVDAVKADAVVVVAVAAAATAVAEQQAKADAVRVAVATSAAQVVVPRAAATAVAEQRAKADAVQLAAAGLAVVPTSAPPGAAAKALAVRNPQDADRRRATVAILVADGKALAQAAMQPQLRRHHAMPQ